MDNKKNMIDQMDDLFKFILKNVDRSKTSNKNKTKIREEVKGERSFVVGARPARIAVVGRRGAGKSSLINAIFGEDRAEVGDYKSQTGRDRKSTRLNSSHVAISYAVFCLKKKIY